MNKIDRFSSAATLILALSLHGYSANAQRASENVVTSAEDAFGSSVGDDSVGLYSQNEARGFSPKDAGNMRIEGLYYDQQTFGFGFGSYLSQSTTIRVGLSAQSYPFPAPTGIADIRLRLPGDETIISVSGVYGPYRSIGGQADFDSPIIEGKLGTVISIGAKQTEQDWRSSFYAHDFSALMHFTPRDDTEIIGFYQRSKGYDSESKPLVLVGGEFLPPKINRNVFYGQPWAERRSRIQKNFGMIARTIVQGNWRLQAGLFRSSNNLTSDSALFFRDTQPDGTTEVLARAALPPLLRSYSGEARASGAYAEGPRRHTFHFSAKGRLVRRTFGGTDTISLGTATIGVPTIFPEPMFSPGPQSRDTVRQGTVGASFVTNWPGVGEISAGLQKSYYRRTVVHPTLPTAISENNPWLYNGSIAAHVTNSISLYASYTRGLEESGIAPENASNPGEALPASITEQIDAGLRYRITPDITLVAGVFEVSKPYFDRDATNLFARVGSLTHRGVEVSLSGEPLEGLKMIAGAMLLRARVSGTTVDQGLIGEVPPGRTPVVGRLNIDYGPAAWRGFSLNAQVNHEDSHYANRLNTVRIESATTVDLGARYNFSLYDTSAALRFDVQNVTNAFIWTVGGASGIYSTLPARRYTVRLAADF